ncbi:MAG: hypothetical protein WD942_12085 [Dehalococcoidia bacterium]
MSTSSKSPRTITDLEALGASLPLDMRILFERIYHVSTAEAELRLPQAMVPWVERTFGPAAEVERQRIVRVADLVTGEGTLFNGLRAKRPVRAVLRTDDNFTKELEDDAWANPLETTPEDAFGRLSNAHGLTAANVAKYDAVHSIIVFREPDPLRFTAESITAQLNLADQWLHVAHQQDPAACYPYLMWNCLWRAGGSIVHGHIQASLARGRHYAKIERLRRDATAYHDAYGTSYFSDLARVYGALGLRLDIAGLPVLAHLTPLKEKEVIILAEALDDRAAAAIFHVLRIFRDDLGVRSFNLGVLIPPIAPVVEPWDGFPVVIRIVDRGDLGARTSDMGGMEMFAESVVAFDPFTLHSALTGSPGGPSERG